MGKPKLPPLTKVEKLKLCVGCRDNFYNGHNPLGVKECWSLKTARRVRRWALGWWTPPTQPGAFREVVTLSCHHEPGKFAFYEKLPGHAVNPVKLVQIGATP